MEWCSASADAIFADSFCATVADTCQVSLTRLLQSVTALDVALAQTIAQRLAQLAHMQAGDPDSETPWMTEAAKVNATCKRDLAPTGALDPSVSLESASLNCNVILGITPAYLKGNTSPGCYQLQPRLD